MAEPTPQQEKLSSLQLQSAGMPNDDCGANYWLANFAAQLAAMDDVRQLAGVTDEQCQRIGELVKAFEAALDKCNDTWNRTKFDVQAKVLARNEAVLAVRPVVKAIKANLDISSEQLCSLGIEHKSTQKKGQAHALEKQRRIIADRHMDAYRQMQKQEHALPMSERA